MTQWQPHNIDAEEMFLGSVFRLGINSEKLSPAFAQLRPDDFFNKKNQIAFRTVKEMFYKKENFDLLTVSDQIGEEYLTYLGAMVHASTLSENISAYTRLIKERSLERSTMAKLQDSIQVLTGDGTTKEKTSEIVNLLSTIEMDSSLGNGGVVHIKDIAMSWLDMYNERINNPEMAGLTTSIEGLDDLFGVRGVNKTDLTVIGARPKMGKTQLAITIADHVAKDLKKPVMIFSMEMANEQVFERFLTNGSKVSSDKFYSAMYGDDMADVERVVMELAQTEIYIDDHTNMSLSHIRSECRKMKAKNGEIGAVFIDYLTLMKAEKADRNDLAYGLITKGLKDMAKDLKTPVFLLAQLSRSVEQRTDKRPLMSDLRETGQIEQDADRIIFIYRESVYNPDCGLGGLTELIVRANRHGATGTAYTNMVGGIMNNVSECEVNRIMATKNETMNKKAEKKNLDW